ncbi:mannosyltransferase [Changchengzhania lutea]|uniref:mannosyltransferase n=1 Tax=Changchengzhania lutea TaxID=2049305 RepID=UPI00115C7C64|nr:mannosyltransferase [Changchengzhania lutea]
MRLNPSLLKLYRTPLFIILASVLFYISFGYDLVRTDYFKLITLYTALFYLFYKLVTLLKTHYQLLIWVAFIFRAVFILAIPNLSQDFYRFIWDGRMILEGFNPYLFTVESFINSGEFPVAQTQELYAGMGALNGSHFTNYPPINQLCFTIAALFASKSILGSVVVMRMIIIAADFGILYFGKKLLERLNIPVHNIFWFILNPFIIIELTGNLHFEGVMIFFLVWSFYLLHRGKWQWAAVVLTLSISVKLIPLIFLPLFFQWFTKQNGIATKTKPSAKKDGLALSLTPRHDLMHRIAKLVGFYIIVGLTTIFLFAPFYSSAFINNYTETVGLWFTNFEFNASLYYVAREIGYLFRGYNEIAIIGEIMSLLAVIFILTLSFFRKNTTLKALISGMLLVLTFYYFTATTVHPWYIATLLILSVFTRYKFPLVWSFVIILSYLTYSNTDNSENLYIILIEYVIVYGVFFWEIFFKNKGDLFCKDKKLK